jgi:tRNA(fMet)-specific endonuclease VapC
MKYALDTNIVIRYLRYEPNVLQNFDNAIMNGDSIIIPKVVDYEIKRGFRVLHAPGKEAAYAVLTETGGCCDVAEMDVDSWMRAEQIYTNLYRKRFTIGELDILIAAFCFEREYTLVTNNTRDFEKIEGLSIVDWTV